MLALAAHPAEAAKKPKAADRLRALEHRAEQSRAKADALARRTAELEKDLDARRESLTAAAAQVREGEETLSKIESERAALAERQATDAALLQTERTRLAQLTAGLVRLARVPPGGLIAWPGAPVDAARGEMLLNAALTTIRTRADEARQNLANFARLDAALADKKREAERAATELKARQVQLAALVDARQAIYRQSEADRKAEEDRAEKAAGAARDLKDLMGRIESGKETARPASLRPPPVEAARTGLPVAGQVKIRFGQTDSLGAAARGVTMAARPGATVTAPAAGIVRFAGPFKGYREILILEHPGGYHSLIAGMARIDVNVGASLGAVEPVGAMDDGPDARPELYFELRHDGQPVDPVAAVSAMDAKGTVR